MSSGQTSILRVFGASTIITLVTLAASLALGGWTTIGLIVILAVLEVSLSFDNAVLNAAVLQRLSPFWRTMFLTVGMVVAVFGVRIFLPILLISLSAGISIGQTMDLAINDPAEYKHLLHLAHPAIASFGATFLMMVTFGFIFQERELTWLGPIERRLARLNVNDSLGRVGRFLSKIGINLTSYALAISCLLAAAYTMAPEPKTCIRSGLWGMVVYLVVDGLSSYLESRAEGDSKPSDIGGIHGDSQTHHVNAGQPTLVTGLRAVFLFIYLLILDGSFSLDGVIGAFAITSSVAIIAVGLGVGAFWNRSLTVYMTAKGTLSRYEYLEHGAHWAIGVLALIMLATIKFEVPEPVTGFTGVLFISASMVSSVMRNKRKARERSLAKATA